MMDCGLDSCLFPLVHCESTCGHGRVTSTLSSVLSILLLETISDPSVSLTAPGPSGSYLRDRSLLTSLSASFSASRCPHSRCKDGISLLHTPHRVAIAIRLESKIFNETREALLVSFALFPSISRTLGSVHTRLPVLSGRL